MRLRSREVALLEFNNDSWEADTFGNTGPSVVSQACQLFLLREATSIIGIRKVWLRILDTLVASQKLLPFFVVLSVEFGKRIGQKPLIGVDIEAIFLPSALSPAIVLILYVAIAARERLEKFVPEGLLISLRLLPMFLSPIFRTFSVNLG